MAAAAAILAGGQGRRLGGVQKALLSVGGRRLISRQLETLSPLFDEVLVVGGAPFDLPASRVVRHVIDVPPSFGPLCGLRSALLASSAEALVVLACDLPFLDSGLLTLVRDCVPSTEIAIPLVEGRAQPLHARYSRSLLQVVEERIAGGLLRITDLLNVAAVSFLEESLLTMHARHGDLRGLRGINTEADLEWAQTLCSPREIDGNQVKH
jgi:molybdopterin-guanine dinucleotide biosynthesis protein A